MAPADNFLGRENAPLNIFIKKIAIGVRWHATVGRQVSGLCTQHQLISRVALAFYLNQSGADTALAPLKPIIDRRIDEVDAIFDGGVHRSGIGRVSPLIRLAKVRAYSK